MPIPRPQPNESKQDFVDRCMSVIPEDEFPGEGQRAAVCISQWDNSARSNEMPGQDTPIALEMLANNELAGYTPRYETFEGDPHLVVPVVLMVEGVHHGPRGRNLFTAHELSQYTGAWNGQPVPIHHPRDANDYIGANDPRVLEEWSVGQMFNVHFDASTGRLLGEAWINVNKCRRISPTTLTALEAGEAMEVSTGVWADSDGVPGTWNNEEFEGTAMHIRPDHLALLPGGTGACSIADGCGVRVHTGDGIMHKISKLGLALLQKAGMAAPSTNSTTDKAQLIPSVVSNEEVHRALQELADAMDRTLPNGDSLWHWVEESFPDGKITLRQHGPEGEKFFATTFTSDVHGVPTAINTDGMVEVRRNVEFIPLEACGCPDNQATPTDNDEGEPPHTQEEDINMSTGEKVTALITHEGTQYTEDDRTWLSALEEAQLDKMLPSEEAPAEEPAAEEPAGEDTPETMEVAVAAMPEHLRGTVEAALKIQTDARAELITELDGNELCTFEKVALEAMDTAALIHLQGIMAHTVVVSVPVTATAMLKPSYVAAQAAPTPNAADDDGATVAKPMLAPKVHDYADKDK